MVASLDPLMRRRQGSCTCAGSQATAVIHLLCPTPMRSRLTLHSRASLSLQSAQAALGDARDGPQGRLQGAPSVGDVGG